MSNRLLSYAMSAALLAAGGSASGQQPQPGADFPEGPAKAIVVPMCGACHDINRLKAGYTPEGWRTVMRMMQNMEIPVPADQWTAVTDYLIKSFPTRAGSDHVFRPRAAD